MLGPYVSPGVRPYMRQSSASLKIYFQNLNKTSCYYFYFHNYCFLKFPAIVLFLLFTGLLIKLKKCHPCYNLQPMLENFKRFFWKFSFNPALTWEYTFFSISKIFNFYWNWNFVKTNTLYLLSKQIN